MRSLVLLGGALTLAVCAVMIPDGAVSAQKAADDPSSPDYYSKQVKPILQENCVRCHSDPAKGGLKLDSYEAIFKGGEDGDVIIKGDVQNSMLIQAVQRTGDLAMPPKSSLAQGDVQKLVAWVKAGAKGSDEGAPAATAVAEAKPAEEGTEGASASLKPAALVVNGDFFENKVRPILAENCYSCHTDNQSGGFQLDTKANFEKGGEHGSEVVPGDPDKSRLIQAVEQTGALKMPRNKPKLSDGDIAILKAWVKAGAKWPAHEMAPLGTTATTGIVTDQQRKFWSFLPLRDTPVPAIADKRYEHWAKTPIDHFVLDGLHKAGLTPAKEADRRTLIRRATLDMTGLPPTEAEVEAFVHDRSSKAWEKVVDRLLASPRYGERWGRHWLDVARYAEDDVRGLDPKRRGYMPFSGAYRYRDWVISAFNNDVPYDQFLLMQLAGDKLPYKSEAQHDANLIATSYMGAGPWVWDQAEPVQGRADERNERVDAVSRGMLGLTVGCARCHNHKYDAITQKDYYRFVSIFASSTYKAYPVLSAAQTEQYEDKVVKEATLQADLRDYTSDLTKQLSGALAVQTAKYMTAAWHVLGTEKQDIDQASSRAKLDPEVLQRWVAYLKKDHEYPYLNDWKAMVKSPDSTEEQAKTIADAFQKEVLRVHAAAMKVEEENEIIKDKNDVPRRRLQIDAKPSQFETFDEFCPGCELSLKALPTDDAKLYGDIFQRQAGRGEERGGPGVLVFTGWDLNRRLSPAFQDYIEQKQKEIGELNKWLKNATYPFVNGYGDKPKPIDVHLNIRGNPHSLGPVIQRGFLTVLSPKDAKPFTDGSGRLEFAKDIAYHPLATRVIVNRIWMWNFGSGIVNTPDNFGVMGDKPSNPELLEYLSYQFVAHGHSIKWLQREILLSAVYQQSSEESPDAHNKDAANRLYSHFNRQRLDAEELRDSMLFAAGDLDLKDTAGPSAPFGPKNLRRTVYCKVSRFRLNNYLQVFDFPNPSFTAEQRFSSNVPLQQLYFMNNPFVYDQASALADRVHDEPTDEARITKAYEYVYQRKPTADELQLGVKFLSTTPEKPGYQVNGEPITAWREYARVLLTGNEFQFVD
ncbi:MAG TPA: PSD1 and planctomycete cytochrome C domain-containing protein [Terracidiphilus sp.]|nr:PSD1 and planctomycete cytochrome C domain-containing protein [Terracidiphilus sp.]